MEFCANTRQTISDVRVVTFLRNCKASIHFPDTRTLSCWSRFKALVAQDTLATAVPHKQHGNAYGEYNGGENDLQKYTVAVPPNGAEPNVHAEDVEHC